MKWWFGDEYIKVSKKKKFSDNLCTIINQSINRFIDQLLIILVFLNDHHHHLDHVDDDENKVQPTYIHHHKINLLTQMWLNNQTFDHQVFDNMMMMMMSWLNIKHLFHALITCFCCCSHSIPDENLFVFFGFIISHTHKKNTKVHVLMVNKMLNKQTEWKRERER